MSFYLIQSIQKFFCSVYIIFSDYINKKAFNFFQNLFQKISNYISSYSIEQKDTYVILSLKRLGFVIYKLYLPIDKEMQKKKLYLSSKSRIFDITHPFGIRYFLNPNDMGGDYFLLKDQDGSITKIFSLDELKEVQKEQQKKQKQIIKQKKGYTKHKITNTEITDTMNLSNYQADYNIQKDKTEPVDYEFQKGTKSLNELKMIYEKYKDKIIVLDFYALWCRPCMNLKDSVMKLIQDTCPYTMFILLDIEELQSLGNDGISVLEEYNVTSIPLFVIIRDSNVLLRTNNFSEILSFIQNEIKKINGK